MWGLLFFSLLFSGHKSFSAACCGGGFAVPGLVSGDDRAQLSMEYGFTEVVVDSVNRHGIWSKGEDHQQIRSFSLSGAHLLSDRWQAGFSAPLIQREYQGNQRSGLGDVSTSIGYEYLTDWDYHPWRPKGVGFLQLTLPTGKSRAESEVGGLDSRGNGFYSLGLGTLLTKVFGDFDVFSSFSARRSFEKSVSTSLGASNLQPGWGGQLSGGFGYNAKSFRYGSSLTWSYEDEIRSTGLAPNSPLERFATFVVSGSYLYSSAWAGTLSYSDQTLFGSPVSTSLGRGLLVQIQRRWSR